MSSTLNISQGTFTHNGKTVKLSQAKVRILAHLIKAKNAAVPAETIARAGGLASAKSVNVLIFRLRVDTAKLGVPYLVKSAYNRGYYVDTPIEIIDEHNGVAVTNRAYQFICMLIKFVDNHGASDLAAAARKEIFGQ